MKEENNIDKYFKSQLEGGEAEVPEASWNAIKGKIENKPNYGIFSNRNSNNNKALLLFLLFGALISGIGFYGYHLKKQNELLVQLLDKDDQLIHKEEELYRELLTKSELAEKANQLQSDAENESKFSGKGHFEKKSRISANNQVLTGENNSPYKKIESKTTTANPKGSKEKNPRASELIKLNEFIEDSSMSSFDQFKVNSTLNKEKIVAYRENELRTPANVNTKIRAAVIPKTQYKDSEVKDTFNKEEKETTNDESVDLAVQGTLEYETENNISKSNLTKDTSSTVRTNYLNKLSPTPEPQGQGKDSFSQNSINGSGVLEDITNKKDSDALVDNKLFANNFPEQVDSLAKKADSIDVNKIKEKPSVKEPKDKKNFRIANSVEFLIAPEVSYRSVSYSEAPLSETARHYKANDKNRFAYSGGVIFTRDISKRLYLQTGVLYSNFGDQNNSTFALKDYDTTYTKNVRGGELQTTGATVVPAFSPEYYSKVTGYQSYDSSNVAVLTEDWAYNADKKISYKLQIKESVKNVGMHIKNSINYVGVPLVIGTNIGTSKWRFGVFSGVIINVLLSPSKVTAYSYAEKRSSGEEVVSRKIDLNRFNFVYWGGIDLTYTLNEKWSIRVAPTMKRFMNSIYKDSDVVKQMPYSYGVQIGLKYNFIRALK